MKHKLLYWIPTAIICVIFTLGGLGNLTKADPQVETMTHLGYPTYLMTLLGVAKLLAVLALLWPGFGMLKEWAYAGLTFDLIGASWSHFSSGDRIDQIIAPLAFILVLFISRKFTPESRRP